MVCWELIRRWLDGQATNDEKLLLDEWGRKSKKNKAVLDELSRRWADLDNDRHSIDMAFRKLKQKIHRSALHDRDTEVRRRTSGWGYLKVAASLILLSSLAMLLYFSKDTNKGEEIEYITSTTHAHQRSVITLSDGSIVKLNARSTLTFPRYFNADTREVALTGEAYFQVTRDAGQPFIVKSANITTTVLGTSFNVRAFRGRDIEVTVASGKVNVSDGDEFSAVDLVTGQQAVFQRDSRMLLSKEVDPALYLVWYEKKLQFERISFGEVLTQLERIYNVHINVERGNSNKCLIRVMYEGEELENVLQGLQLVVDFDYRYQNDSTITVSGNGCLE